MDNPEYNLMVDELLLVLKEHGFNRQEAELQLAKLLELSILRVEKEILEESSIPQNSLTLPAMEKVLSDYAEKHPEIINRVVNEFESVLKDYLAVVCG